MKAIHRSVFLSAVLLATAACAAQDIGGKQTDADAVYTRIVHEYAMNKDGSTSYSCEKNLRYLTYFSFNRAYGETFIIYNPEWQSLAIGTAETRMADGTLVKAPANAFNEVLPRFAAEAANCLHLREMVVTHTGLERNAEARLAYRIDSKKGFMPGLSGKVVCGERSPVQELVIRIILPRGSKLNYEFLRSKAEPVLTQEGENIAYTWTLADVPMIPVESRQPAYDRLAPALHFSTYDLNALRSHVMADRKLTALPPAATAAVAAATAGKNAPLERALALKAWVENNCALADGDPYYLGYKPYPAAATFGQAAGSKLDRAVLLSAMCAEAGLDASPVLTAAEKTISSLHSFTGAAVLLRGAGGGDILLDPNTAQHSPIGGGLDGAYYLTLDGEGGLSIYGDRRAKNSVSLVCDWTLRVDGTISGRSRAEQAGVFGAPFDPQRAAAQLKRALGRAGQGMKVSEEKGEKTDDLGSSAEAEVASTGRLENAGGLIAFALPATPFGIDEAHLQPGPVARATPVALPAAMSEELRLTLHLPAGMRLAVRPDPIRLKNGAGEVRSEVKYDGDLEVVRMITFATDEITAENYPEFRKLLQAWDDPAHRTLFLSEGGK